MVAVSYPPGASGAFVSLPMICHIESVVWPVKFRICHHSLTRNLSQSRYTHSSIRSLLSAQQTRDRSYDPTLSRGIFSTTWTGTLSVRPSKDRRTLIMVVAIVLAPATRTRFLVPVVGINYTKTRGRLQSTVNRMSVPIATQK